ncbi:MAG: hypothetical protein AM1032_000321 [Mycoplasmataceae bacterium]|nr:MAG: hypothetical protein AM1032_000321 [Mycoplasmataceae bacterium]
MNNLQIEDRHLKILKDILSKYPYQFYVYGSRAKGTAQPYSDLDICYKDIPWNEISNVREDLTKSNLPFFVELVNWDKMTTTFQEIINKDLTLLN